MNKILTNAYSCHKQTKTRLINIVFIGSINTVIKIPQWKIVKNDFN